MSTALERRLRNNQDLKNIDIESAIGELFGTAIYSGSLHPELADQCIDVVNVVLDNYVLAREIVAAKRLIDALVRNPEIKNALIAHFNLLTKTTYLNELLTP